MKKILFVILDGAGDGLKKGTSLEVAHKLAFQSPKLEHPYPLHHEQGQEQRNEALP